MSNTVLTVSGLSFDAIRSNLRNFLITKDTFKDVDFTDSAVGTLIDLLAYNSYLTSFYTNMSTNEAFLDTAQLYDSVVSRAKSIGYVPISARGASANVLVTFGMTANTTVRSLTIAKNARFTTSINGASYIFVTPKAYTISANSTNKFGGYITIVEGTPLTHRFTYSAANSYIIIPNANTDLSSVSITVTSGGETVTYTKADDIFAVTGSSKVFFTQADTGNRYRISFGDNVIGAKPPFGSTVLVSYRVCSAAKTNGANTFASSGALGGQSNFTIRTSDRAAGGSEQEPIESVRYNAPLSYETQNRAVTSEDYRRIILRDNPDMQSVNVWGGEDNIPPIYGRVFISVKPNVGMAIGTTRKDEIKTALKRYNVQTIDPQFVDATFLYLSPTIISSYNPVLSTGTASDIANKIATVVVDYEATILNRFDGKFRASKFINAVDLSDNSIVGSTLVLTTMKRFIPDLTRTASYTFMFNHPLNHPNPGYRYAISSSAFTYKGSTCFIDDDGFGIVRIYYLDNVGTRVYVNNSAGTVNYQDGRIDLMNFFPSAYSGTEISITVEPSFNQYNMSPVRNQIILLRDANVSIVNDKTNLREVDRWSISTLGSSATVLAPSYSSSIVY